MFRTAGAFIKKDFLLFRSYKANFVMQIVSIVIGSAIFYFIGEVFTGMNTPVLKSYGGEYFPFLLIGIALTDYLSLSMATFNSTIRENQMMGTLEIILLSPLSLLKTLIFSSLWSYIFTSFRFICYILVGVTLYGLDARHINVFSVIIILILSTICFMPVGIIVASAIMIIKRGDPINVLFSTVSVLLGGVAYPTSVLPDWLNRISFFLPITHSLTAMRKAVLQGYSIVQLLPEIGILILFAIVLFPIGLLLFTLAVKRTKVTGTMGHY